jgi:hypothetical protein
MAEGIFQSLAKQPNLKDKIGRIDSCGTGTKIILADKVYVNLLTVLQLLTTAANLRMIEPWLH